MTERYAQRNYRKLRQDLKLNQDQFWSAVKVTQSGGSRYESGRKAPAQVDEMVRLHHVLGIDTTLITEENADLIRAILNGALNAVEVVAAANRCRELVIAMNAGAEDLSALAGTMSELISGVRAEVKEEVTEVE